MPRTYKPIDCSKEDIILLNRIALDPSNPRLAVRAKIVLRCADGQQVKKIAAELGERPNTVILWRNRFAESGIEGLLNQPRGTSGNKYGSDAKKRILQLIANPPPDGAKRWTGALISKELNLPTNVIWRCLRKEGIHLSCLEYPEGNGRQLERYAFTFQLPIQMTIWREQDMTNKEENKSDLEFIARIKGKDGTVIEKKVVIENAFPDADDFDISTMEGFRRDFDEVEKTVLKARNDVAEDVVTEFFEDIKKNGTTVIRNSIIESELGRITCAVTGALASSLQPKEHINSIGMEELLLLLPMELSIRKSTSILNRLLRRSDKDTMKKTTLEDFVERKGVSIAQGLQDLAGDILSKLPCRTYGATP